MIPDEGPPMKRIQRAVREVARDVRLKKKRSMRSDSEADELDGVLEDLFSGDTDTNSSAVFSDGSPNDSFSVDDLPEIPRDWKVKFREKVQRNMDARMIDVHVRCEIPEGGLDLHGHPTSSKSGRRRPPEERAFAIGFTLESLVVRTANEQWEVGSHDFRNPVDGSRMSSVQGHLGPNEYVVKNNKIGYFKNLSFYWDDEPPVLLVENDTLRGNFRKLSADRLQQRITDAMDAMMTTQEPGLKVRQALQIPLPEGERLRERGHEYICESLCSEVRVRASDRTQPGPISCSADVLPFSLTFRVRQHQYRQYRGLQAAIKSQQRLDTMLHGRPASSPSEAPRAWWRYVISSVTARPNWRPWEDIQVIVRSRRRYIELVVKKNAKRSSSSGYHAGLSEKESQELLAFEDLLPIEALLAFHLIALRQAYSSKQKRRPRGTDKEKKAKNSRFRLLGHSRLVKRRSNLSYGAIDGGDTPPTWQPPPMQDDSSDPDVSMTEAESRSAKTNVSLLEAMTLRLGKKMWFIDWKLHDATFNLTLLNPVNDSEFASFVLRGLGSIRSFGLGRRDCFLHITQFDVLHGSREVLHMRRFDTRGILEDLNESRASSAISQLGSSRVSALGLDGTAGPDMVTSADFLDLPSTGVVCSVCAAKNHATQQLSLSSHPATLIWYTNMFDSFSDFFADESSGSSLDLTNYIRNNATPLARKAQLALLSPSSVALFLNVAAPKIWLPVASKGQEGALLLDAGSIRLSGLKTEGHASMTWDTEARDIRVSFARGRSLGAATAERVLGSALVSDMLGRNVLEVVRAFDIHYEASSVSASDTIPHGMSLGDRIAVMVVSPLCINLVDGEVLARAFGKWYSKGLRNMKHRDSVKSESLVSDINERNVRLETRDKGNSVDKSSVGAPRSRLSIYLDNLEIAVEGHSKTSSHIPDDQSMISLDSTLDHAARTRVYLFELRSMCFIRSSEAELWSTSISIGDVFVARLKDRSTYQPFRNRRELTESENCILTSVASTDTRESGSDTASESVFRATILHDGSSHLDEIEVDVSAVVLRVTPSTLKDFLKATRRLAELAQVMTREMERKVHEEGRLARRKDSTCKCSFGNRVITLLSD